MRADTLALLKELNSPVYRWPGGNFVSGYDWKDGIGDRDRRPPRKNPAWTGVEHNDFGLDEFMAFCRIFETEPHIVVNSGTRRCTNAVAELQYVNGAADTPMGKRRAANGHPTPSGSSGGASATKCTAAGNWDTCRWRSTSRSTTSSPTPCGPQTPSIKLVAVGDDGPWSEGMMRHCADHMDLISEHFYRRDKPDLAAHVQQIPDGPQQGGSPPRLPPPLRFAEGQGYRHRPG